MYCNHQKYALGPIVYLFFEGCAAFVYNRLCTVTLLVKPENVNASIHPHLSLSPLHFWSTQHLHSLFIASLVINYVS